MRVLVKLCCNDHSRSDLVLRSHCHALNIFDWSWHYSLTSKLCQSFWNLFTNFQNILLLIMNFSNLISTIKKPWMRNTCQFTQKSKECTICKLIKTWCTDSSSARLAWSSDHRELLIAMSATTASWNSITIATGSELVSASETIVHSLDL